MSRAILRSVRTSPNDTGREPEYLVDVMLVDLDELGTVDWDAFGYGCRALFFDVSTKARRKASVKPGRKKQAAQAARRAAGSHVNADQKVRRAVSWPGGPPRRQSAGRDGGDGVVVVVEGVVEARQLCPHRAFEVHDVTGGWILIEVVATAVRVEASRELGKSRIVALRETTATA